LPCGESAANEEDNARADAEGFGFDAEAIEDRLGSERRATDEKERHTETNGERQRR
jgi:hypothetical protein